MKKKILNGIKSALSTVKETRITTVSAAWVYYFLLALVPIAFLLFSAFNLLGIDLFSLLSVNLNGEVREIIGIVLQTAENVSKTVTIFFIFTVVFSASALLSQMSKDGEHIYGIKNRVKKGFMRRLSSIVALAVLFVVFLLAGVVFAFGNMLLNYLIPKSSGRNFLVILVFLFIILFCYGIIILINGFISPIRLKFSVLCTGGIASLSVCVIGTIFFILYLRIFNGYNAFYGSLAGIVVFLLWAYILMLGIAIGPLTCMKIYYGGNKSARKRFVKNRKPNQDLRQRF